MLPVLAFLLAVPELLGHQALGPGCLSVLTSPPLFHVGAEPGPFEMVLVGVDAQTHPLVIDARPPGQVLRSRLDARLPRGIGWVVLRGAEGELARWNVLWDIDLTEVETALAAARATPLSQPHHKAVVSIKYSPNGQLLAAASADRSASILSGRPEKLTSIHDS